jgi:hypothetical protein
MFRGIASSGPVVAVVDQKKAPAEGGLGSVYAEW